MSVDSIPANREFAKQIGVTFPILSDFKRTVVKDYGVFNEEQGFGNRATFVIDKEGIIRGLPRQVNNFCGKYPQITQILICVICGYLLLHYTGGPSLASNSCISFFHSAPLRLCSRRTQRFQRRIASSLSGGLIFSAASKHLIASSKVGVTV